METKKNKKTSSVVMARRLIAAEHYSLLQGRQFTSGKKSFSPLSILPPFYIFLIALGIFVAGVQIGIHHGRCLQAEDLGVKYTAPWEVYSSSTQLCNTPNVVNRQVNYAD